MFVKYANATKIYEGKAAELLTFEWLEYQEKGLDSYEYRCSLCNKYPQAGSWCKWRQISNLQKSILQIHDDESKHKAAVKFVAERDANSKMWKRKFAKQEQQDEIEVEKILKKIMMVFWLGKEEVSIRKFPSLVNLLRKITTNELDEYHNSVWSAWSMIDCVDLALSKTNSEKIRAFTNYCLILDTCNDSNEWLIVQCRGINPETGDVEIVFWDLLNILDSKAATIAREVKTLYKRDSVELTRYIGWTSDGASCILAASRLHETAVGKPIIVNHCESHRLDLCISSDTWKKIICAND